MGNRRKITHREYALRGRAKVWRDQSRREALESLRNIFEKDAAWRLSAAKPNKIMAKGNNSHKKEVKKPKKEKPKPLATRKTN